MPTQDEFVQKFRSYSDEQLYQVHACLEEYSAEGQAAFAIVIAERGNMEQLTEKIFKAQYESEEHKRLRVEASQLLAKGLSVDDIESQLKPRFLTPTLWHNLLKESEALWLQERANKQRNAKLVRQCVIGSVLGGNLGGLCCGLLLICAPQFVYMLAIGLVAVVYGCIFVCCGKLCSQKVMLIVTLLGSLYGCVVAQLLCRLYN